MSSAEEIATVVGAIETAISTGEAISDPRAQTILDAGLSTFSLLNPSLNSASSVIPVLAGTGATILGVFNTIEDIQNISNNGANPDNLRQAAADLAATLAAAIGRIPAPQAKLIAAGLTGISLALEFYPKLKMLTGSSDAGCIPWGGDIFTCADDFEVSDGVDNWFLRAQRWVYRADPLTFDLDGDGIETVPLDPANPILFDHNADGIKTATGWIGPDDAFLVLDRNGNGTIDNGSELFGDSTPLLAGGNAVDGFAALSDQDTNADGQVNASDANFANLRLWRDLNQDGVSQANELFTLPAAGIASITVAKTENNTLLPNGNVLADVGSYTKTNGSAGALGLTGHLGDVDLREETFYSQFTDTVPLTPEARLLPGMHGSGRVRNLREAA